MSRVRFVLSAAEGIIVAVLDLGELLRHWGYLAIVGAVLLGNVGLPVPEESVLVLSGYLVWTGQLRLPFTLAVGILSATAGDNLGYWIGRRYGRGALERYGRRIGATPARFDSVAGVLARYGALGVFAARFFPGLRFLAGPLAGAGGLSARRFVLANLLGAMIYVPYAVGLGYVVGYGLGNYVRRLERFVGKIEHAVLIAVIVATLVALAWRAQRAMNAPTA